MVFSDRIIAPFGGQFRDTPTDPGLLHNLEYYFTECTLGGRGRCRVHRTCVGVQRRVVATPIDPLRDINGLKKIDFVMKDGQVQSPRPGR
jgi:hypothetical protein